jgi:ribosomal protein S14
MTDMAKTANTQNEEPLTLSVPEAGWRYFKLCRATSYEAAARGEIPTIRVGRKLRVPVRALERMLDDVTVRARRA